MLVAKYEELAKNAASDSESLLWLLRLARYDERVVSVVVRSNLIPHIIGSLDTPGTVSVEAARFLSNAIWYDKECGDALLARFVNLCQALSRANTVEMQVAMGELLRNVARVQPYRASLFNYSEAYRHLLAERNPFLERAVTACLAYTFCDDFLGDAVATLQYKTDVLNYVSNIFARSHDFAAWRYSVRCLSAAGGYNEDKSDVDYTRALVHIVTDTIPQCLTYFFVGFVYARLRHIPRGPYIPHVPYWIASRRAFFAGTYLSVIGVYSGSYTTWRLDALRESFANARQQEMRKRYGALRSGIPYAEKKGFDNIDEITNAVFRRQVTTYGVTTAALLLSVWPMLPVKLPGWMGDVKFKHPWIPQLFPILVGVPAPSHRVVPYIIVPFCATKAYFSCVLEPTTSWDWFVQAKYTVMSQETPKMSNPLDSK